MNTSEKFICTHQGCHKEYSTKFALRRHFLTHSGVKPFKCTLCSKSFMLEQYLSEHMNVHSKAKPFECGINGCKETFRQRGKLCLHRMTHPEYKKKEYRVFARKKNARKAAKPAGVKVTPGRRDYKSEMFGQTFQSSGSSQVDQVSGSLSGFDLSQYCYCDISTYFEVSNAQKHMPFVETGETFGVK